MPIDNSFPDCPNINTLEKKKFKEDSNGDVCVNVCIADDNTDKNQNAFNTFDTVDSDPGNEKTVITFTMPADSDRLLTQAGISTYSEGCVRLKVNGSTIQSGRTGPSLPNILLKFDPHHPITDGDVVVLTFESRSDIAVVPIDGWVSGIDC